MVQNISNSVSSPKAATQANKQDTSALRSSFERLSVDVAASTDAAKVQAAEAKLNSNDEKSSARIEQVIAGLNEAVSSSAQALESVERLATVDETQLEESEAVRFTEDFKQLREQIGEALSLLREHVATAEVIAANMQSAGSKLEDVDSAHAKAVETGAAINTQAVKAMGAHVGLTINRVNQLLQE